VSEVNDGTVVRPDHIYVIRRPTQVDDHQGRNSPLGRADIDARSAPADRHFLRSLAEDSADRAISVILSGTASDGAEGSRAIKAAVDHLCSR